MEGLREKFNIEEFNSRYKGTREFCFSRYFATFEKALDDNDLMEKIRFANDYLKIPPVKCFVNYYREIFSNTLERGEKLCVGACFGYLYKIIYGYKSSTVTWINDEITGIKNASYFVK